MFYLLNPRVWFAIIAVSAFTFTNFAAYRAGKATVRAQWNADIAARTQQALEAERAARVREQFLVDAKQKSEARYVEEKRKAATAAASAGTELGRLRDELAAAPAACPASANPAAGPRTDGIAGLERELLGHCATALVRLAAEADRLEAQVVGLQGYVNNVCLKR